MKWVNLFGVIGSAFLLGIYISSENSIELYRYIITGAIFVFNLAQVVNYMGETKE